MRHAMLSASGSSRWLNCTPSARLEQKYTETRKFDDSSDFAKEGTLAHDVGELLLKVRSEEITKTIWKKEMTKLRRSPFYSKEMEDHYVEVYADYVMEQFNVAQSKTPDSILLIEERLDFSHIVEEGFGTGDAVIISDGVMEVIDLKYGKGVKVSPEDNSQLKLYGLGGLEAYDMLYDIHTVRLTVFQPRIDNVDSWEISKEDILKWAESIVKPKAKQAYEGDGIQQAGDWCRFCKVKGMCATIAAKNIKLAQHEFADPHLLKDDQLLDIYKQIPMLVDWAKGVETHMLKEALNGKFWKGLKVVEGRSNRKWKDEKEVVEILMENKFTADKFTKSKLQGIPAIQKLVGNPFHEILSQQVIKPEGRPTLVSNSDKRSSILGTDSAKNDFDE